MNIVLDARFWRSSTGGIGRYTRELTHELLALGTDDRFHLVITPLDAPECAITDPRVQVEVVDIPHYSIAEQLRLPGILAGFESDLVHFLNFNQPVLYRGTRVTTIHDLTVKKFPVGRSQTSWVRRQGFDAVMRHAAASDAVIAISEATKRDILTDLKPDPARVHVIYESADERFRPHTASELAAFRTLTGREQPYILFVSQWRPHKGLPELITAFEHLKSRHRLPYQLVVTGKPSKDFPELSQAIERSPVRSDIVTPGFVDDDLLPGYYAAAAAFAFPSHYEGFGLPVLEAMQSGTPVVCTDTSSLPEVGGRAARYVEPERPDQLAKALYDVLTDDQVAVRMRNEGIQQAAKFSWQTMAKQTHDLYSQVAATKE